VVPNGVDTERFRPQDGLATVPELLFVGAFRHHPNILAFESLLSEIMPAIWARFPQVRLRVVAGTEPQRYWTGVLDSRIDLLPFVSDLRPLYSRAWVVLAPLLVSAGTNIKVLEAMACGKAVVTTSAGCRGLGLEDGVNCAIREAAASFATATIALLEDEALRKAIGRRARWTAEQRFSWTAIANHAYGLYTNLGTDTTGEHWRLNAGD
jgi:glycosyltransferase involved in cell wall biosynthesis